MGEERILLPNLHGLNISRFCRVALGLLSKTSVEAMRCATRCHIEFQTVAFQSPVHPFPFQKFGTASPCPLRPANLTTTHVYRSIDCGLIKTRFKVKRNHVSFTLQRPKDYICECSLEQVHRLWAFERKLIRGWKQSGGV